jgi:hypothetical protein
MNRRRGSEEFSHQMWWVHQRVGGLPLLVVAREMTEMEVLAHAARTASLRCGRLSGVERDAAAACQAVTTDSTHGMVKETVAPESSFCSAQIRPPCASTINRLIDNPIPLPVGLVV